MSVVIRGAIFLLIAFYLYVMYIVKHPHVSDSYREYYMLRTSDVSIGERKRMLPIQIGHDYMHKDATTIGFNGWAWPEDAFRWNTGKSAGFLIKIDSDTLARSPTHFVFDLMSNGKQHTHWQINGVDLGEYVIEKDGQFILPLKPGSLRIGENVIKIDMPDAHRPNQNDDRELGLAFKTLRLE
jgi:hypothetical protein